MKMTVFIGVVTSRLTATVDTIRPITLHLAWLVHQTIHREEVGSLLHIAVTVLGTLVLVRVPPICLPGAKRPQLHVHAVLIVVVVLVAVIEVAVVVLLVLSGQQHPVGRVCVISKADQGHINSQTHNFI